MFPITIAIATIAMASGVEGATLFTRLLILLVKDSPWRINWGTTGFNRGNPAVTTFVGTQHGYLFILVGAIVLGELALHNWETALLWMQQLS